MEITMNDVEKLLAIEEIKKLKARYFRCVDTKDWEGFSQLFALDAVFDISEDVPGCILVGPQKIASASRAPLDDCVSVHHGHCPEIDILSEHEAAGVWAMEDMLRWPAAGATPSRTFHGYGHYFETYEKLAGRWYIKTMQLRRLRADLVEAGLGDREMMANSGI